MTHVELLKRNLANCDGIDEDTWLMAYRCYHAAVFIFGKPSPHTIHDIRTSIYPLAIQIAEAIPNWKPVPVVEPVEE